MRKRLVTLLAMGLILLPVVCGASDITFVPEGPEEALQTFLRFACLEEGEAKLDAKGKPFGEFLRGLSGSKAGEVLAILDVNTDGKTLNAKTGHVFAKAAHERWKKDKGSWKKIAEEINEKWRDLFKERGPFNPSAAYLK